MYNSLWSMALVNSVGIAREFNNGSKWMQFIYIVAAVNDVDKQK